MNEGELVKEELSGRSAKSYVSEITRYHRIQGSSMYHEAALYLRDELRKMGKVDVELLQFPADGKRMFWTHENTIGWSIKSAELRMLEPRKVLLARFEDTPQALHTFSRKTPIGGVVAELVDVGKGVKSKDYKGKKVRGKIVLATGGARQVHQLAVIERGAVGVVTDSLAYEFPNVRESIDIPDAHSYQGIWPTGKDLDKIRFGFSLSKRQGNELRALMAKGKKVKLKADVDSRLFPGKYDVVSASIKGASRPEEEVFLIAHLCHPKPGANDNASGSGLLLEIARTISALIRSRKIKRPARTIRFFWVPETTGTVAMLSTYPEMRKKLIAGINLDMVGEDQDLCGSTLHLTPTPDSLPSYLNDLVQIVLEKSGSILDPMIQSGLLSTFRFARVPYGLGSDHAEFVEPTTGVPCVSFTQWPDKFYHTSMDTIDKVSETSLKRVGWTSAIVALKVADADKETILELAGMTSSNGLRRIADASAKASGELLGMTQDSNQKGLKKLIARSASYHLLRIEHIGQREIRALRSVERLGTSKQLDRFLESQENFIRDATNREIARIRMITEDVSEEHGIRIPSEAGESKAERLAKKLVPRRLFKGTLGWSLLRDFLGEERYEAYDEIEEVDGEFFTKAGEVINFTDGRRTVHEIVGLVSSEYGQTDDAHVLKYLRDLELMKLIAFRHL